MDRTAEITVDVREMPYVRQIAEFMCENSKDTEQVQHALWRIDAMATADVQSVYLGMQAATAEEQ